MVSQIDENYESGSIELTQLQSSFLFPNSAFKIGTQSIISMNS